MFNTLKYYKFWFTVSGLILAFGVFSLAFYGLKLGIDFKGGSLTELQFNQNYDLNKVRAVLDKENMGAYQLQTSSDNQLLIKTQNLDQTQHLAMESLIGSEVGAFKEVQFESIGPVIGSELKKDAIYQLALVSLGIVLYIGYAFRRVSKPVTSWRFGW